MTSYMYNPSAKVTELLSKFLEFDPEQLELGIWSGDLSLKNVNLRKDAVNPLLNKTAMKPHMNPLKRAPLHLNLVSGKVGHMRIKIPWKKLVWGQDAVRLEISDVMIVLSLQSREETERQKKEIATKEKNEMKKGEEEEDSGVSKSYREAKQRRLREAERRHLQGLPVALYLENLHRKNIREKDAARADEATKTKTKTKIEKGRIERWVNSATSTFFWRFYAGLQGSIKKVRVVVVQDGVEVGCIVQSIEVIAGKEGNKISITTEEESYTTDEPVTDAEMTPPEQFFYKGAYDDGEHVDKTIRQRGLGIFIRKEASQAKVHPTLRFSTSVSADDYILRPVDLDVSFSFFYPYPPERRTKQTLDNRSNGTPTNAASTAAGSTSASIGGSTTTSSKRRRGKRDRIAPSLNRSASTSPNKITEDSPLGRRRQGMKRSSSFSSLHDVPKDSIPPILSGDVSQRFGRSHRRLAESATPTPRRIGGDPGGLPQLKRYESGRSLSTFGLDGMTVYEALAEAPEKNAATLTLTPRFDCGISLNEIRVVFSTRHYELLNYFISTVLRMENGRPDKAIRSVRMMDGNAFHRNMLEKQLLSMTPKMATQNSPAKLKTSITPPTDVVASQSDVQEKEDSVENKCKSEVPLLFRWKSARSEVVKKWWDYAIGAILWEIRKRKHLNTNFRQMYLSFDWNKQRYRRQEYIELYISLRLDKPQQESVWPFEEEDNREQELLEIEDELPLEQILLYRSIARSIGVRGATKMPATIHNLHRDETIWFHSSTSRGLSMLSADSGEKGTTRSPNINPQHVRETTLLSLLQKKFEMSQRVRLKGGTNEKFSTGSPMLKGRKSRYGEDDRDVGRAAMPSRISREISRESKHSKAFGSLSGESSAVQALDGRMRISCSFKVKCIDLLVVQEDYHFEMPPVMQQANPGEKNSPVVVSRDYFSKEVLSSVDDVSDLSVMTDDERFFSEDGKIGGIAEEENDDGGARMSSTDFLNFGLPEDLLLRISIESLGTFVRGESGGTKHVSLSVGHICAVGDNDSPILLIGPTEPSKPIEEVDLEPTALQRRQSKDSQGFHPYFDRVQNKKTIPQTIAPGQALSLLLCHKDGKRTMKCDFSKIGLTVDLTPAANLLKFYSSSQIVYPNYVLSKSSREVARKFMLSKTANTSTFGDMGMAIRVHGLELTVPFVFSSASAAGESVSDHSEVDNPDYSEHLLGIETMVKQKKACKAVFVADTLELYRGAAVDEIVQGNMVDLGTSRSSLRSNSVTSKRSTLKTLEMLDVMELTSSNDAFACTHWVVTAGGIDCVLNSEAQIVPQLTDIPVDVEILVTVNEAPLLETESPKKQVVVEVSPVNLILSEHRLDLISAAKDSIDFSILHTAAQLRKRQKADSLRIEILARRVVHSIELSCRRVQVALVKDGEPIDPLALKYKEVVMEECLSDFLSVVSCFDFSLPNEEALSSAMQVCIGRLVGLGLSDDEAWGCTNTARLNFLDDIARMQRAQTNVLVQLSNSIGKDSFPLNPPLEEDSAAEDESASFGSFHRGESSLDNDFNNKGDQEQGSVDTGLTDDVSDDDSANSADIVETTLHNAVEKTVANFSSLLQEYHSETKSVNSILTFDMPLGIRLSTVKLFYDSHITCLIPCLAVTNSAGIELLTLVPHGSDSDFSLDNNLEEATRQGLFVSRFNLDEGYDFGKGGLPMSVLASDEDADNDSCVRERSSFNDIAVGEVEFLFCSKIYEAIIDDVSQFGRKKSEIGSAKSSATQPATQEGPRVESSSVLFASSLSMLFTSDELVPFSRLTLEELSYKNKKALESSAPIEIPNCEVLAESLALQNLTPEGQFYPEILAVLSPGESKGFAFQLRYFESPDPWQFSNRLQLEFNGFRLYLLRRMIYEILHYFAHENYGVGRLRKKYSKDVRDIYGNYKPPLLYSVIVRETSVICPRSSSSSDMAAFEVKEASISVSYIPETFKMPTQSSPFEANPHDSPNTRRFDGLGGRRNSFMSLSDYHDCMDSFSDLEEETPELVSAYSQEDFQKRLTINLQQVRVFTAISKDKATQDIIESPLFRFLFEMNGRAGANRAVYSQRENIDRPPTMSPQSLLDAEKCEQYWEEISTNLLDVEVLVDYAPHLRLLISSRDSPAPFSLDARLSQLCLLLSVWDDNMQEMPTMFPFDSTQVSESASPPQIPEDFPKYGTEEFVSHLEDLSLIKSEICCIFGRISLRCTYDEPGRFSVDPECFQYFEDPRCRNEVKPGIVLSFDDAVIHVINDLHNVKRIGIGASSLELLDERRRPPFQRVLATAPTESESNGKHAATWADVGWGLRDDLRTLSSTLPQPVQFTVFMTPGWSLINVGAQSADGTMFELSWIWLLLDYFKSYYCDVAFGNPGLRAQRWSHKVANALRKANGEKSVKFEPLPGVNVDFRLWLCRPILCIPSDYLSPQAPCLRIESNTGLRYCYKSISDLSSQEVTTTDLNLYISSEFQSPQASRRRHARDNVSGVRPLIEGLSFGLRYDCNNFCNHKDVSVQIPFAGDNTPSLAVAGQELEVDPLALPSPTVCTPFEQPSRSLGPKVCEITCIIEVIPITTATMMNFFKGPAKINDEFAPVEDDQGPPTFSVATKIRDLRIFAIDPILGVQLPIAVASLASASLTITKFGNEPVEAKLEPGEAPPEDMQVTAKCHLWAEYFKLGMTRSWEPLLEPFEFMLLYEISKERGRGFSMDADSPLHVNVPGALLQILSETIYSFRTIVRETFGDRAASARALRRSVSKVLRRSVSKVTSAKDRVGAMVEDSINMRDGQEVTVLHEIPKPLMHNDRVAFSLRNLTGQKVRIHQQTDLATDGCTHKPAIVTYLHQAETMGLTFAATISVIKNLSIVEVPYPGLPNSRSRNETQGSLNHAVDIQIPGFRWIQGMKVDTFGRKFESLTPRSTDVLAKIFRDWRLQNAMMLLTEVGLDSGGRLMTVRSLFEVRNSTAHAIKLVYHPDPRHEAMGDLINPSESRHGNSGDPEEIETILPGDTFHLPILLLERALQMTGSHLGCLWLCPDTKDRSLSFWRSFRATGFAEEVNEIQASFCSRPIQLAKLVHESEVIFQSGSGKDVAAEDAKSGVQLSCSTRDRNGDGQAPFCYAIEVGRSPIVNLNKDKILNESKGSSQNDLSKTEKKNTFGSDKKAKKLEKIHGPVAYTLSIHPPLVVVNLLPVGGRFELMHAARKIVIWYADLQPGQQIPVHSVGLDAPLLLLVNLGYCRTPVGEGALVHHGIDAVAISKGQGVRFKSLGKAVTKGTKQIGKTLTTISDSPDKRGRDRIAHASAPQLSGRENRKDMSNQINAVPDGDLGLDTGVDGTETGDGKVHSVESMVYAASDIAEEMTVVDGVGQRLTLSIENIRGGGGQRRVSLFCPFWIVNTTEHALRYKQDKAKTYVSGTVNNAEMDGSRPVDGSNRNYRSVHGMRHISETRNLIPVDEERKTEETLMNAKTIFSGTPGALATSPGKCNLAISELTELIDNGVTLEKLADLAFMFNFYEEGLARGQQMLCVQLFDGTGQSNYATDWSRGFSLDSVGFSQIVGMHCKEGRTLELSVEVSVAPGFMSAYTKIVRFLPRYVVFNRLDRPIRLWQDSSVFRPVNEDRASDALEERKESRKWRYSFEDKHHREKINQYESLNGRYVTLDDRKGHCVGSQKNPIPDGTTAHRSALYISTILPDELIPFVLPDSRAERQLRIDLGGTWNVTSSFASDLPGDHTLKVSKATDLGLLNHVSTRAAPKYKIVLPPPDDTGIGEWDGELGVFFETDWGGDRRIIVKGTKRGKYAFNHTDIHVGDELLRVDGISVVRMSFAETMKLIKDRLAYVASVKEQQKDKMKGVLRRLSVGVPRRISLGVPIIGKQRRNTLAVSSRQSNSGEVDLTKAAQLTLTFRTLEERLRKLRVKAGRNETLSPSHYNPVRSGLAATPSALNIDQKSPRQPQSMPEIEGLNVELKSIHNTMFVILRERDDENPKFRIQNRSMNHIVFYRQRGCNGHPWNQLMPGESLPYSWEEPIKAKKLIVRVAAKSQDISKLDVLTSSRHESISELASDCNFENEVAVSSADQEKHLARAARVKQALAYQFVDTEETRQYGPSITVRLEEIGYRTLLPVPLKESGRNAMGRRNFLNCEVDTDGGTRLLVVSDDSGSEDERSMLDRHLGTLKQQTVYEKERFSALNSLRYALLQPVQDAGKVPSVGNSDKDFDKDRTFAEAQRATTIEEKAKRMVEDFPEEATIASRHQVVIEIVEAVGLNVSDFVGNCNPYCEIFLKGRSKSRKHFFQKRQNKRKTYFIEKSLEPKWSDQVFVFNVPEEAVMVTRGHSIQVKVRNFRLVGQHPILGQTSVHFGSLRSQQELVGWYPLAGRTGRRDVGTAPLSDWSRGSVKLRVQWIYTTHALIDYFLLLSSRRLERLEKSQEGMKEQLTHAIESDRRKREARDQLTSGRIQKLVKLQKRYQTQRISASSRTKDGDRENVVEKFNQGINSRLTVLKDTLKASRDRYLYALYFQTVESRKNRKLEREQKQGPVTQKDEQSLNLSELPMANEQNSPGSYTSSSKKSLENFLNQRAKSPFHSEASQARMRTLSDFFAQQTSVKHDEVPALLRNRSLTSDEGARRIRTHRKLSMDEGLTQDFFNQNPKSPFRSEVSQARNRTLSDFFAQQSIDKQDEVPVILRNRSLTSDEGAHRIRSHRKMSLDEGLIQDIFMQKEVNPRQGDMLLAKGQALFDGLHENFQDLGISDLISVSTDVTEEAKHKKTVRLLLDLGFAFHESGAYFHQNHLPHHFRRSLFASAMEERKAAPLYCPKNAVGRSSAMRYFKSWQAAQALYYDAQLEVIRKDDVFLVRLKENKPSPREPKAKTSASKAAIVERLTVPEISPLTSKERAQRRIEAMFRSRTRFVRACKRTLGSVLNPGGWLTIRPITVLNLPDTYTGMFVKLRYGSGLVVSETVDAKVTPRWAYQDTLDPTQEAKHTRVKRRSSGVESTADGEFKFSQNDLHVHVEPQQTSGFIKISVVAERLNQKTELGLLQIPLGAAIAACIDSAQNRQRSIADDEDISGPPMYVRWFPLMSPSTAVPVEGDMGLSSRPTESEQVQDNMFKKYFTPCLQLALIWWPDSNEASENDSENRQSEVLSGVPVLSGPSGSSPQPKAAPLIQTYFNADIGRISAALIDSQRALELLSVSAIDIDVRYSVTKTKTRAGLVVGWIQLDHQDNRAREPVVLAPTPVEHLQPTLQILALKDNVRTKSNIVSFEYIGVALQEMDLTIEESWVFELWDFLLSVMRRQQMKKNAVKGQRRADVLLTNKNCFTIGELEDTSTQTLLSVLEGLGEGGSAATQRKFYVEQLILGLVKINLSYVKGKKQSRELSNEGTKPVDNSEGDDPPSFARTAGGIQIGNAAKVGHSEVFTRWSQNTYEEEFAENRNAYNLPGIIATVFPSVSDAPIRLHGKAIDHVFESPEEIFSSVKNFYVNETLKQVYKIIGSLDFVGNPTILFSSFVSGVRDLVVAPTTAFLNSPTNVNQVGIGVAKGALSLFSHSASGIFGFAAKMSATAGQAAAILSLDKEFSQWHRERIVSEATNLNRVWKRRGVQSASEMLTRPVGDILRGVILGASGLFVSPYKGFRERGSCGLVQGVAIGTAGVVAKPLVGVLDAITHFSATVHDIAKIVNVLERRYQPAVKLRLPYVFGPMNILSPFDPVVARSVLLLRAFPQKGKHIKQQGHRATEVHVHSEVLHMEPGVETYAIATNIRVVLIKVKKENNGTLSHHFGWEVDLSGEAIVSSRLSDHGHNGVSLTITKRVLHNKADSLRDSKTTQKGLSKLFLERPQNTTLKEKTLVLSSAVSLDSNYGDSDDDVGGFEDRGPDKFETSHVTVDNPLSEFEAEAADNDPDEMNKRSGISELFTVLAEYQHRRQLTSLHNAICCIVGDFNAIVQDNGRDFERNREGVTNFGLFGFESEVQDERNAYASNAELVAFLENLPWMHEKVFERTDGMSRTQQREYISKLRQNWVFSRDLEASMEQGGPGWLIDARAKAMFVSSEATTVPGLLDPTDPFVQRAKLELGQGHVNSEQANELVHSQDEEQQVLLEADVEDKVEENDNGSVRRNPTGKFGSETQSENTCTQSGSRSQHLSGDHASHTQNEESIPKDDSAKDVFHVTDIQIPNPPEHSGANDSIVSDKDRNTSARASSTPQSGVDFAGSKSPEGTTFSDFIARSFSTSHDFTPDVAAESSQSPPLSSRIDRMESLMEQLLMINSHQIQKQLFVPEEGLSDGNSVGTSIIADSLINDLADLRAEVKARKKEDDALRTEISVLRKQLAERRDLNMPEKSTENTE